jgi:hypothetical protein
MAPSLYPHPVDPESYPEYTRRAVKAVTRSDLDDQIQFTALRVFSIRDGKLEGFREDLDIYTGKLRIGKIIWPFYRTLFASNFGELVDEIARRKLWLFDFWGYVPGSDSAADFWGQYQVPTEALGYLRKTLGPRFLGMDNGEQDGRYIGGYAPLMCPALPDRARQYENFARFFEALGDDMGHHLSVLCSLNYGHYFAKEADSTILGEESGQALPNVNVWFSYLRGASRQYGLLTFGNASIWNRWGYKSYESEGRDGGSEWGPTCGTSLSLLKRLLYTEYLYGCEIIGFEQSWILSDSVEKRLKGEHVAFLDDPGSARLSPVGELQVGAVDFVEKHGRPGVLHVPVALFMGFHNGWTFPRHLYTGAVYKAWGNRPYEAGDYQVDALFTLLYPGYEDAGFYRDERGFVTATPYGDSADVLFSDARPEVLGSYAMVVVAGEIELDLECADKLSCFVEGGGRLVISAGQLPPSAQALALLGIRSVGAPAACAAPARTSYGGRLFAEAAFSLVDIQTIAPATILARVEEPGQPRPLVLRMRRGQGTIDVVCALFGTAESPAGRTEVDNSPEKAIPHPVDLLQAVKAYLHDVIDAELLLDVGNPRLQFCVAVEPGQGRTVTVSVSNNTEETQPFALRARGGALTAVCELEITAPGRETLGYYPPTVAQPPGDARGEGVIGSREIRVFRGTLHDAAASKPKIRMQDLAAGIAVALREVRSLRREVLSRPTLLEHAAAVKIDAEYIVRTEIETLRSEGAFLSRVGCGVVVDLTGLLTFYPDLTLLDNVRSRWESSRAAILGVFDKARALGARDVLLSLHRNSENSFSLEQAERSFRASLRDLAFEAAARSLVLHLEHNPFRRFRPTMRETLELARDVGTASLRPALNACHAIASREDPTALLDGVALVLLSAPGQDRFGQLTDDHAPIAGSPFAEPLRAVWRAACTRPGVTTCLDAVWASWDDVYRDLAFLRR